jgi:hypothetical protein
MVESSLVHGDFHHALNRLGSMPSTAKHMETAAFNLTRGLFGSAARRDREAGKIFRSSSLSTNWRFEADVAKSVESIARIARMWWVRTGKRFDRPPGNRDA